MVGSGLLQICEREFLEPFNKKYDWIRLTSILRTTSSFIRNCGSNLNNVLKLENDIYRSYSIRIFRSLSL